MRAAFRELLDRAEEYVRATSTGEWRDRQLADIAAFRRAPDFPDEREVIHAFEKFLWHARSRANGDERLLGQLAPYVEVARCARERIGGHPLPGFDRR